MEIYNLIYKKENNINNLRILGETFVKNNRNKGGLIIKNKKYYLKDILSVNKANLDILKIKMILNRYTYNFNCLFKDCISLTSLSTSSIDNTIDNVIYEENISEKKDSEQNSQSENESSFSNISEISKTEGDNSESANSVLSLTDTIIKYYLIKNHKIIKEIFYNCKSLLTLDLPDISN